MKIDSYWTNLLRSVQVGDHVLITGVVVEVIYVVEDEVVVRDNRGDVSSYYEVKDFKDKAKHMGRVGESLVAFDEEYIITEYRNGFRYMRPIYSTEEVTDQDVVISQINKEWLDNE